MAIITLTSDWRNGDYYVGAVKGKILSYDTSINIVDISHNITAFNVMHAAFILTNCYKEFPDGTIHIIGVNSVLTSKRALLIIEKDKQFFLCSDSGFPGLMFPDEELKVYRFNVKDGTGDTFMSLNLFVEIAFKIIKGNQLGEFANLCTDYEKQFPLLPTIDKNLINGSVVYIDSFSNAICNITRETFEQIGQEKPFEIFVQSNHYTIDKISNTYADVATGELVAIFNSTGLLEIAMVNGPAAELLSLKINSTIRIKFFDRAENNELLLSGE